MTDAATHPSEVAVFEFDDDWEALGRWSSIFGDGSPYPFEGIQRGDLIMFRGGSFEIFTPQRPAKATVAPVDETQLRLQVLSIAVSAPRYGNDDHKKSTREFLEDLYSWVSGS